MNYQTIDATPISGSLGAEILGVDLSQPLSNAAADDIQQALWDHKVVFFRDQDLSPEDHLRVAGHFGDIYRLPFVNARDGYPDIIDIVKEPEDAGKYNFGGVWHTDASFEKRPPMGSALYALETPEYGGDTMWANMEAAYEALSEGMKKLLGGMRALHSAERNYGSDGYFNDDDQQSEAMTINPSEEGDTRVSHPVIRTHPETGRKSIYVNPVFTVCFEDMTEEESAPLLNFLYGHMIQPQFTCRFNWTSRTLAIWDNRCTMHFAINDYNGKRRHMNRVTISGEEPQ